MRNLRKELDSFWHWASMTPIDYSRKKTRREWETDYPHWDLIYESVKIEIEKIKENNDNNSINDILEAMAIDNECEIVLDLIENNKEITNIIVKKGYAYCQPETRWQVAELIRRIGGEDSKNILIDMITNDKDKYVQRRALLSLNEISEEDGKKYASTKLDDDDDILKKVSLRILEGKTSLR